MAVNRKWEESDIQFDRDLIDLYRDLSPEIVKPNMKAMDILEEHERRLQSLMRKDNTPLLLR